MLAISASLALCQSGSRHARRSSLSEARNALAEVSRCWRDSSSISASRRWMPRMRCTCLLSRCSAWLKSRCDSSISAVITASLSAPNQRRKEVTRPSIAPMPDMRAETQTPMTPACDRQSDGSSCSVQNPGSSAPRPAKSGKGSEMLRKNQSQPKRSTSAIHHVTAEPDVIRRTVSPRMTYGRMSTTSARSTMRCRRHRSQRGSSVRPP
mmetsp:Transcript_31190/g.62419  ORF Transcript_31190/g.62419 Transcript_31190/m.62419 type:complete len:209 (-) Transcript_31190:280-906(-)